MAQETEEKQPKIGDESTESATANWPDRVARASSLALKISFLLFFLKWGYVIVIAYSSGSAFAYKAAYFGWVYGLKVFLYALIIPTVLAAASLAGGTEHRSRAIRILVIGVLIYSLVFLFWYKFVS